MTRFRTILSLAFAAAAAVPCSSLAQRTAAIRVACVGDSITAGYLASPKSNTYPAKLQLQLDGRYGAGSFAVSNFGAGGATVQKGADSPYWNRSQYTQWVNGTYDIIIVMLGTNDAKVSTEECVARWGKSSMCANNWPTACSSTSPAPTSESCTVIRDYLSLIKLAKTLGPGGRAPLVTVMTPPPLWKDGAYGMSNVVLNDLMPKLVPRIASLANLAPPIDVFSALGGVSTWRQTYPACGCQRPQPAAAPATVPASPPANYTGVHGYMAVGEVIADKNLTWNEAAAACTSNAACAGFTFKSNSSKPSAPVSVRLKQCEGVTSNGKIGWWSWTKPASSIPAPAMPASCGLFCATGQSCDACHPDNDGYELLATKVFNYIVEHHKQSTD